MKGFCISRNGQAASCRQLRLQRPDGGTPTARSVLRLTGGTPVPQQRRRRAARHGFMLIECLVYIGVLFVVLGVGYAALYHCMSDSARLRRNADDIVRALNAGEIWRADIRNAQGSISAEPSAARELFHLPGANGGVAYRFETNTVFRRVGTGPWTPLLQHVKSSAMQPEPRKDVSAWRWELELQTGKSRQIHTLPLFTFFAVPANQSSQ